MSQDVLVAGVGMIPFVKPAASSSYDEMGSRAVLLALEDSGLAYHDIQQAIVGYVFGDSTCGQAALYRVGMTGIPIINVHNNCSTGSSALFLARTLVRSGAADCVLVLGFEQMSAGALSVRWADRPSPLARFDAVTRELTPEAVGTPEAIRYFGGAAREYMQKYRVGPELFAAVRAKASRHAVANTLAIFRKPVSVEEVLASPEICPGSGMTRLMACPPTCGAAAAVIASASFAARRGLDRRVRISAQAMTTDTPSSFAPTSMLRVVGFDMARAAADQVYEAAGVGPNDVNVCELHDCFAPNEVIAYESLRLCSEGDAEKFVADGDNTYGGRVVTNPSGGLLSKGHPLGATGVAQCSELVHQLRGAAGVRQVPDARIGLQHNIGLGGAGVVTLYERLDP